MGRFTLPRDLYHGTGSLETLKTLTGKKAIVVVGGGSMKRFGFLDKAVAYLKEAGMEVELFEGVEPDPSVETVMKGAEAMRKFQPDWIVAMGGGSPIDAAKAMWVFYEYPDTTFEEIITPFSFHISVVRLLQVVMNHLDCMQCQRVGIIAVQGGYICLDRMCHSVHTSMCNQLFRHSFCQFRIYNGNVRRDIKVSQRILNTFFVICDN